MDNSPRTWLITGSSRGLGRAIAGHALAQGDRVAATARRPGTLDALAQEYGDRVLTLAHDVNDHEANVAAARQVREHFGRIDVLVNNAGYGLQGMTEEVSMAQVRAQMETNFFGLVDLTQQVLPAMREQGSGYIVNISSIAGLAGISSLGIYNASKFAVEGFSEALAQEVKPFGIRVSIVEPGPYRTDWAGASLDRAKPMQGEGQSSAYAGENEKMRQWMDSADGQQPGDPQQIARVLFDASRAPKPPLHMIFGDEAIGVWEKRLGYLQDESFLAKFPHERATL